MRDRLDKQALLRMPRHQRRPVLAALQHQGARVKHQVGLRLAGLMAMALEAMRVEKRTGLLLQVGRLRGNGAAAEDEEEARAQGT